MSFLLNYGLWIVALVLQSAIGVFMIRKKLHKEFAAFFCYTAYQVFRSAALFAALRLYIKRAISYGQYFYIYWICEAITVAISFLVIYSLFGKFLARFPKLRRYTSVAFMSGIVILLSVSIVITAAAPSSDARVLGSILLLNRSLWVVQAGLIFFLFLFARFVAVDYYRDVSFGIALGFGVLGTVELAALFIRTGLGEVANTVFQLTRAGGYQLALVAWLLYILAPQRKPQNLIVSVSSCQTDQWAQTLTEMLKQ